MRSYAQRCLLLGLLCTLLSACGGGSGTAKKEEPPAIQPGPDPLYSLQWHLENSGQAGGRPGVDVNVVPVWNSCQDGSCRGEGVRIAIVDDGLQIRHPDLWHNAFIGGSLNFLTGGLDPTPGILKDPRLDDPNDGHGTAVAGLAAARDNNSEGGRGVAPRAQLVGYNLLKNPTLANQTTALTHNRALVAVSNNSWGAPDETGQLQPSDFSWRQAIETGLREGRGGLGTVYVWAAGNGGRNGIDNSNYDGRANYHGVMAIGAVDHQGNKAGYSEEGANLWLVAPGGSGNQDCTTRLVTTDLTGPAGANNGQSSLDFPQNPDYTRCMAGTSASTPLVSGVVALVLQARPELTWRDVRLILAESARREVLVEGDWTAPRNGYRNLIQHSHQYGFGLVDAAAAVELARSWPLLPLQQRLYESATVNVASPIPANSPDGLERRFMVQGSGIDFIEWIDLELTSNHSYAGNLEITLSSPTGVQSKLALPHACRNHCTSAITNPNNGVWTWRFGSARHLGEMADGPWTLRVVDNTSSPIDGSGDWLSWKLVIRGHSRGQ